jgi:hypothetical protein
MELISCLLLSNIRVLSIGNCSVNENKSELRNFDVEPERVSIARQRFGKHISR